MASPIANALTQFIDNRGNPLGNGTVSYFMTGSTTPKGTWRDPGLTIANAHPVVLDTNGRAPIFGTGRYRQQVRSANGTLLFDAETSIGEGDLPLATELAARRFDEEVMTLQTSGFSSPGKGAACYVRLPAAPASDEQAAGTNRWLFKTNGGTVWWRLSEARPTDLMFGVLADAVVSASAGQMAISGSDDTPALQAAVDYILYFAANTGRTLHLPSGMRKITNTIHLGYGQRYLDWRIEGDFTRGSDANAGFHAGIFPTFNDRPALNIQGARSCRLRGIAIYGVNFCWLQDHAEAIINRADRSSWDGGALQSSSTDTSCAPYCAIAVDGYSGQRQANSSYPDAVYPAWLGVVPQYGKASSSGITSEDLTCSGFEVGLAVQPNVLPSASNGDFLNWIGCDLSLNLTGLSISNSDARAIALERCRLLRCHTALDSVSYGSGSGNIAASLSDCTFDNVYRIFNINLGTSAQPFAPALVLINPYGEAVHTIGIVRTANATGRPGTIRFVGGELGFSLRAAEFSPSSYLDGRGEVVARFENVSVSGTYGIFAVDCDLADCSITFPAVAELVFEQTTAAGRRAASALAGIDAPHIGRAAVRPFCIYANDNAAQFGAQSDSHGWDFTAGGAASSGVPLPLFARSINFSGHHAPIAAAPTELLDRASFPLIGLTKSGAEWSFTCSGGFLSDPSSPACCIGRGDVVRDEPSGVLLYVKSVSLTGSGPTLSLAIVLRQITAVRSVDGITWSTEFALSPSTGLLHLRCGRRVLPGAKRRLAMTTTAGSNVVSLFAIGPEDFAGSDFGPFSSTVQLGDYLVPAFRGAATLEDSVFAKARVSAVATSAGQPNGQLTLDATARRSGSWPAPIFIKGN